MAVDDVQVQRRRHAPLGRGLAPLALTVAVLIAVAAPATAELESPPESTSTSTSTTAPEQVEPVATTTPSGSSSTTTTASDTPTTAGPSTTTGGAVPPSAVEEDELPPASVASLPPEESLPPLITPGAPVAPPPGADDSGRRRAQLEIRSIDAALKKAKAAEAALRKRLEGPARRLAEARAAFEAVASEDRAAADGLREARSRMRKVAVAGYVHGGEAQPVDYLLQAKDPIDFERRRTLIRVASDARRSAVDAYSSAQRISSPRLEAAVRAVDDAQAAVAILQSELDSASAVVYLLALDAADKRQLLDHQTAAATADGTDIPRLFLDAYRQAAAKLGKRAANCRVGWTAIAAIGKVESNHGRYRGAQFALNGDVFPRILGIPLDGTRSALIRDTDAGVLDTDLEFDRAVGPMQFIPSTWARINEDGNGDGISDPNNIYDAALGTAAYLCRAVPGGGLDTDDALRPAFFSYNHSSAYVEKVLAWAHTYAGQPPPVPPGTPAAPEAPVPAPAPAP